MLKIIKARLVGAKGAWPEELPIVLQAYRTAARTPTGETPFNLTYGTEAVTPIKLARGQNFFDEHSNDDQLKLNWIVWMKSEIKLLKEWPSISERW